MEPLSWLLVSLSLIGNYYVIKKNVLGLWIWSCSNLGWIFFDISIKAYSQAFLFFVYFLLCIWGIISWTNCKTEPKS